MSELVPERVSPQTTRNWLPFTPTAGVDWSCAAPLTLTPVGAQHRAGVADPGAEDVEAAVPAVLPGDQELVPIADSYGEASVTPVRLEMAIPDALSVVPLALTRLP